MGLKITPTVRFICPVKLSVKVKPEDRIPIVEFRLRMVPPNLGPHAFYQCECGRSGTSSFNIPFNLTKEDIPEGILEEMKIHVELCHAV